MSIADGSISEQTISRGRSHSAASSLAPGRRVMVARRDTSTAPEPR